MSIHVPVLLKESVDELNIKEGSVVVDATLGGGGHSLAILKRIGDKGKLIAIDTDEETIERFKTRNSDLRFEKESEDDGLKIQKSGNVYLVNGNFADLDRILESLKIEKVDAILADLGYSSDQLEDAERGMSFLADAPLDMRLDRKGDFDAGKIVNGYPEERLERIFREYGEENFSRRIARKIVEERAKKNIGTTLELVGIIRKSVPEKYAHSRIHFATRTFQAIRIEVNGELDKLKMLLDQAVEALSPGGRIGIISFHSLEDRIVKESFKDNARGRICSDEEELAELQRKYISAIENDEPSADKLEKALKGGPGAVSECAQGEVPKLRIITKKPIVPQEKEAMDNPRSRSAKLRIAERI